MKSLLAMLFCFCATCLLADQNNWPALYDVQGVARGDVLNIRQAPTATAPIIGRLAFDATQIEVVRQTEAKSWALVNTGEQSGWVLLAYLERQPGQAEGKVPQFTQCFGTEPFWTLSMGPNAGWSTPNGTVPLQMSKGQPTANRSDRFGITGVNADNPPRNLSAIIRAESCSDGMSDRVFGLGVDIVMTDASGKPMFYAGCCSIAP